MQLEEKDLWQKNKWILYALIFTVIAAFILNRCNNSTPSTGTKITSVKVTTAEVKGNFEPQKPVHIPITGQVLDKYRGSNAEIQNYSTEPSTKVQNLIAENQRLVQNFKKQTDSLKQKLYEQAIQLNSFNLPFEDENIKIDVKGIVQGEVKSVKPTYTIKPKVITVDVTVKEKERVFSLKTGAEYGNTMLFDKGVFKGNLEFENKKANSYNIGYDTDQRIWLGAKFTIFSIKK